MTPEELAAKIAELETKNAALEEKAAKLDEKVNPAQADPDAKFRPNSWEENYKKQERIAEETAMRVLKEAEDKRTKIKDDEDKRVAEQDKQIEDALKKLEEEGIIEKTSSKEDVGGKQRQQILGMAVRTGGRDVEAYARSLKSAWENGLEYDYERNEYIRAGSGNTARLAPVGSSVNRTPVARPNGPIDVRGIRGDLDEAQRRYEASHT